MAFQLTDDQLEKIKEKMITKRENVLKGDGFFKLDTYQCAKYLKVNNRELYNPMCSVISNDGVTVGIKAYFGGSNSTEYGSMPVERVQCDPNPIYLLILCTWNWIKRTQSTST